MKPIRLCSIFAVLAIIFACTKEEPTLSVSPSSISYAVDGGTQSLTIISNGSWTVSSDSPWVTVSPSSGTENGTVNVKAAANTDFEARNATICVASGSLSSTVAVSQSGVDRVLRVVDGNVDVPATGGNYTVDLEYNVDYDVLVDETASEWLSFIATKATSTKKLEFSVKANQTADQRVGKVYVDDKGKKATSQTITFTQAPRDVEKEALMDLYNSLRGTGTWEGWGTDAPISDWLGVTVEDGHVVTLSISNSISTDTLIGKLPESLSALTHLRALYFGLVQFEGTIPESYASLVNLESITFMETTIEGPLPDIFGDMKKLKTVNFYKNKKLTGPVPNSLFSSPVLERVSLLYNNLSGTISPSWFTKKDVLIMLAGNRFTGELPIEFYSLETVNESFWETALQALTEDWSFEYTLDVSNAPFIPATYDTYEYYDYDGSSFYLKDVFAENKYTIIAHWGLTNPYAESFIKQLKSLYGKYHGKGLEVVSLNTYGEWNDESVAQMAQYIKDNGIGEWRNVNVLKTRPSYPMISPTAEIVDQNGHLVYTWRTDFDYGNVFGHTATLDLQSFVMGLYGDFDADYESTDYSKDGEVKTLQKATKGNGIDIVIMGDAYVDRDMDEGGLYETVMAETMEAFFDIEPYKTYRDRFNVYAVKAVSKNCSIGEGYETKFSTAYGSGTSVTGNVDLCVEYALKVPEITSPENLTIITLINSGQGGATTIGMFGYNSAVAFVSAYSNDISMYGPIVRHEAAGHGFAHLADEYDYNGAGASSPDQSTIDNMSNQAAEKGWWANIDFTSDPDNIKWSHFLKDSRYSSTVGIIEGGSTYPSGVWRPTEDSMMNNNQEYFNAPSREAIFKRIMKLSGEDYSFEKFVEYDKENLAADKARMGVN